METGNNKALHRGKQKKVYDGNAVLYDAERTLNLRKRGVVWKR